MSWNGGGNWCSPVLGVLNDDTFLFLHRQHCFIQGLWSIAFCFSWMWPCCLRRGGGLVGTLRPQQVPHTMRKTFPLLCLKKKTLFKQKLCGKNNLLVGKCPVWDTQKLLLLKLLLLLLQMRPTKPNDCSWALCKEMPG